MDQSLNKANSAAAKKNRLSLYIIAGVCLFSTIGPYLMHKTGIGIPTSTRNEGALIRPAQSITELPFFNQEQLPYRYTTDGRWVLMLPVRGECGQDCKDALYLTRQTHIALGKNAHALKRIYLNIDGGLSEQTLSFLQREHPRLDIISIDAEAFLSALGEPLGQFDVGQMPYLLIDPQGFAMMYYTSDITMKGLLKDLKFLIGQAGGH